MLHETTHTVTVASCSADRSRKVRDTIKASILGFVMFLALGYAALYGMEREHKWHQEQAAKAMGVGRE